VQTGVPPVVGLDQLERLRVQHANERKNEQPDVVTILQVDATKDGSMAYDDGSVHVVFDDAKTGEAPRVRSELSEGVEGGGREVRHGRDV
jgi:hypothetical protein